ncbi:acyl-CoA thioesterase domain-containing protein [Nocardia sp. NPDC052566]|uniref:acyl-CoA thioesterase domain-containing protein n=1 Tax=Nocardia sp. NPDC052566 TaxID=3364330 RepID=UPI0037C5303D
MSSTPVFFTTENGYFVPAAQALSLWSERALSGPPICGLVAREFETNCFAPEFVPGRFDVELHRPVPARPLTVGSRIIRDGKRLRSAEATVYADGRPAARARLVLLRKSAQPPGIVWSGHRARPIPATGGPDFPDPGKPLFGSDGHASGWSTSMRDHHDSSRKRTWLRRITLIDGEAPTPFVVAAILGEQASFVANWGSGGVGYINIDVSMVFARLPSSTEMGIEADDHLSADGIAACSATLYDADGPIATSTVSAIAGERQQLDLHGNVTPGLTTRFPQSVE